MRIEFLQKKDMPQSPYFTIEDVLTLYREELIDKHEARSMLSYITKIGWLL